MEMLQDGKVVHSRDETEITVYEYMDETLEIQGGDVIRSKRNFSKAVTKTNGKEVVHGFQGRSVLVHWGEDGVSSFTCEDGTEISEGDRVALKNLMKDRKKGEKDIHDLYPPPPSGKGGGILEPGAG